ncbi:MAG: DUF47 domain-containing protein [Acetivibrionales bacterium]|jgi:uncharacterized protein Yka (UPF0111/DUF47 family)|nr:DUF47 family protein [Clostridiaceae bacterium]
MGFFSGKDVDCFELFQISISYSRKAAMTLKKAYEDGPVDYNELKNLKAIEHEADIHVHRCLKMVEEAFITPIDRSDIVEIIKEIENITDSIDSIANHTYMMCVNKVNDAARELMGLVVDACVKLEELMKVLKNFKKEFKKINDLIIEINNIEEAGDKTYLTATRSLFEFETDTKKILVWKLLYDQLESALDKCEDVADIVQKIIISKT